MRLWPVTARPRGPIGVILGAATLFAEGVVIIAALLSRLPGDLEQVGGETEAYARGLGLVFGFMTVRWIRAAWVLPRIPGVPSLAGKVLHCWRQGRRVRLDAGALASVSVRLEPPPVDVLIVVEASDGEVYEVCPLDWPGAPRLYARLAAARRRSSRP